MNRLAPVLLAAALLPGCASSLLAPAGAPPALYTLAGPQQIAVAAQRASWQLAVDAPNAAQDLDSTRIALSPTPDRIDYYANVAWVDRAPVLIEKLIIESFERSGRIDAVQRQGGGLRSDFVLATDLRDFEVEAGGAPVVHIRIGAKLERMRDRSIVAGRVFDAMQPISSNDFSAVVAAFEGALAQLLPQMVDWTLTEGTRAP